MYSLLLATTIVVSAVLGNAIANAAPLGRPVSAVPQAPIGHLQPRAQPVSPLSSAEQAEQQQMSAYDAEQQKLDEQLDKRLNICRGC